MFRLLIAGIIIFGFLLLVLISAAPRRCYCAGQQIDCAILDTAREALEVNNLSQHALRRCY
jgi:hypothetical protein